MKIKCNACQTVYTIPDEKIPAKKATAKCKKCDARIVFHPSKKKSAASPVQPAAVKTEQLKPKSPPSNAGLKKPMPKSPGPAASKMRKSKPPPLAGSKNPKLNSQFHAGPVRRKPTSQPVAEVRKRKPISPQSPKIAIKAKDRPLSRERLLRMAAFLIDGLLAFGSGVLIYNLAFKNPAEMGDPKVIRPSMVFGFALLYFSFSDGAILKGQSLGKRLVNLRVQDRAGNYPSFIRACQRYLIIAAPLFLIATILPFELPFTQLKILTVIISSCLLGAVFYLFLFNGSGQSLHDLTTGTYVVQSAFGDKIATPPFWKGHIVAIGVWCLSSIALFQFVAPIVIEKAEFETKSAQSSRMDLKKALARSRAEREKALQKAQIEKAAKEKIQHLVTASALGKSEQVSLLISQNVPVNVQDDDGGTPLTSAAQKGHLEMVKLLLDNEADINFTDKKGQTPLIVAAGEGHLDLVTFLLERGANIGLKAQNGRSALSEAVNRKDRLAVIKTLLENGADVNSAGKWGARPLSDAAISPWYDETLLKLLLEYGADVNAVDDEGRTALVRVSGKFATLEKLSVLLNHGADINHRPDGGWSALSRSAANGYTDKVKFLVKNGAMIDVPDAKGMTPLMLAVNSNHPETAKVLLENGADLTRTNLRGISPLALASDSKMRNLLKSYGTKDEQSVIAANFDSEHAISYDKRMAQGLKLSFNLSLKLFPSKFKGKYSVKIIEKQLDKYNYQITYQIKSGKIIKNYSIYLSNQSAKIGENLDQLINAFGLFSEDLDYPAGNASINPAYFQEMMDELSDSISHFDYLDLFAALQRIDEAVASGKSGPGMMYKAAEVYSWMAFYKNRNSCRKVSDLASIYAVCCYLIGTLEKSNMVGDSYYKGLLYMALDYPAAAHNVFDKNDVQEKLLSAYIRYDFDQLNKLRRNHAVNKRLAEYLIARAYESSSQNNVAHRNYAALMNNYPDFLMAKEYVVKNGSVRIKRQYMFNYIGDLIDSHLKVVNAFTYTDWTNRNEQLQKEVGKHVRQDAQLSKWLKIHKMVMNHPFEMKPTGRILDHRFLKNFLQEDMFNALRHYYKLESVNLGRIAEVEAILEMIENIYPDSKLRTYLTLKERITNQNRQSLVHEAMAGSVSREILKTLIDVRYYNFGHKSNCLAKLRKAQNPDAGGLASLHDYHQKLLYKPIAVECLKNALEADPYNYELYGKILSYKDLSHQDYIDRGNKHIPHLYGYLTTVAKWYREKEEYEDAIGYYQKAMVNSPSQRGAYYELGLIYKELDQPDQAVKTWQKYLKYDDSSLSAVSIRNEIAQVWLDQDRSQAAYDLLLNKTGGQGRALLLFAQASEKLGKILQAENYFKKGAERYPNYVSPAKLFGFYLRQNNPAMAERVFNDYKQFQKYSYFFSELVDYYVDSGTPWKISQHARKLAKAAGTDNYTTDLYVAQLLAEKKLYKEAIKTLSSVIYQAQSLIAHYWDYMYEYKLHDSQQALQAVLKKTHNKDALLYNLMRHLMIKGFYDEAIQVLDRLSEVASSIPFYHPSKLIREKAIAWRLGQSKPKVKAKLKKELISLGTDNWHRSKILYLLGDLETHQVLKLAEKHGKKGELLYYTGIVKFKDGNKEEALKDFLAYLNIENSQKYGGSIAYELAYKSAV